MTQDTPTVTECSRCHRKSEIVPLNIVCPFCVAEEAREEERQRIVEWSEGERLPELGHPERAFYGTIAARTHASTVNATLDRLVAHLTNTQ